MTEDAREEDRLAIDAVDQAVGAESGDRYMAPRGVQPCAASGKADQAFGARHHGPGEARRRRWIVLPDVVTDALRVGSGLVGPDYSQLGGGSSFAVPQDSSQSRMR